MMHPRGTRSVQPLLCSSDLPPSRIPTRVSRCTRCIRPAVSVIINSLERRGMANRMYFASHSDWLLGACTDKPTLARTCTRDCRPCTRLIHTLAYADTRDADDEWANCAFWWAKARRLFYLFSAMDDVRTHLSVVEKEKCDIERKTFALSNRRMTFAGSIEIYKINICLMLSSTYIVFEYTIWNLFIRVINNHLRIS